MQTGIKSLDQLPQDLRVVGGKTTPLTFAMRIALLFTPNIANANDTWEGWKKQFARGNITIHDDDSGYGMKPRTVLTFDEAIEGLQRCTINLNI